MTDIATLRDLSCRMVRLGAQRRQITDELESHGYGHVPAWVRADALRFAHTCGGVAALERYWDEYAKERLAGLAGPVNVRRGVFPGAAAYRSDFMDEIRQTDATTDVEGAMRHASPYFEPSLREWHMQKIRSGTLKLHTDQIDLAIRIAADENSERGNYLMHKTITEISYKSFIFGLSMILDKFSIVAGRAEFGKGLWIDIPKSPWRMTLHDLSHRTIRVGLVQFELGLSRTDNDRTEKNFFDFDASFGANDVVPFWNYKFDRYSLREFHYVIEELACLAMIIYRRLQQILV